MARLAKAWPCFASAVLLNLAFPPFNLGLLVLAGLVPWLNSLRDCDSKQGFRSGWTFGFLLMLGQMAWLFTFINRWIQNPLLSLIPFLLGCAYLSLFFGLLGALIALCWRHKAPWAIPLLWAGVEVFRSYIPALAFPYGLIATPLWSYPAMIQGAYFGSIYVVSAWVVLVNLFLAMALTKGTSWREVRGYLTVSVLVGLGSWVRYHDALPQEKMAVTVGQPGADLAFGDPAENQKKIREEVDYFTAQAILNGSEMLVLPEGIAGNSGSMPPATPFSVNSQMPVVFGGQRGSEPRYQTAFSFDGTWQYADKTRLVIFGEYVPLRNQLPFLASAFNLPGGDMVPAQDLKALKVGKRKVGPMLCFEGLFPDIAYGQAKNGAELLAVMSVDDWYMGTSAPDQLKAGSVWRAVETGLPLVRAASLGYSFAVDQRGRVLREVPTGSAQSFRVELPVQPAAPFPFFPVFPYLALGSLVLVPTGILLNAKRRPSPSE